MGSLACLISDFSNCFRHYSILLIYVREKWRSTETEEYLLHIALFPTYSKFVTISMVFDARLARQFVIITVFPPLFLPALELILHVHLLEQKKIKPTLK